MGTADQQAQARHYPTHAAPWGTWEELLLASAVLRYGNANWALISAELQSRTKTSFIFTPEACQAEYEAIKLRLGVDDSREDSPGTLWFEELRGLRVAYLKEELKQFDNSIGSLEKKIRRLQSEEGKSKSDKNSTLVYGAGEPERAPSGACELGSNIVLPNKSVKDSFPPMSQADSDFTLAKKHSNRMQLNVGEPPCLDLSQPNNGTESASELQESKGQKGCQHLRLLEGAKFEGYCDAQDGKTLGLSMIEETDECNVEEIDSGTAISRQVCGHSGTKLAKQADCNVSGSDFGVRSSVRPKMLGHCSPRVQVDANALRSMAPQLPDALNMKEHGKDGVLQVKNAEVDGDSQTVFSLQPGDNKCSMSGVMGVLAIKQSPSSEWADCTDNKHQHVSAAKNVGLYPSTSKNVSTTENLSRDSSTRPIKLEILSADNAMSEPSIYKLKGGMQTIASKKLDITSPQPAKPDSKANSASSAENSPPGEVCSESLEVVDIQAELARKKEIFLEREKLPKLSLLVTEDSEEKTDVSLPFTLFESSVKTESITRSNDTHASRSSGGNSDNIGVWPPLERFSGANRVEKSETGSLVDGNEDSSPTSKRNKKEPRVAGRLIPLLDSLRTVSAHKCAPFFKHNGEIQSNWRYHLMIRAPMDLGMIRIKLEEGQYSGSLDFFRDLLLLVTNALVYYPKDSSESAAAFGLRECILKEMDFIFETEILVNQEGPTFRKRDTGKARQLSPGKPGKVIEAQISVPSAIDTAMKDLALKQCDGSVNVGHQGHENNSFRPDERAATGKMATYKKDGSNFDAKRLLDCKPCESGGAVSAEATMASEECICRERLAKSLGNEEQSSGFSKATAGAINKNVEHWRDNMTSSTPQPLKRGVGRPPKHLQNRDSQRAKEAYSSSRKRVKR